MVGCRLCCSSKYNSFKVQYMLLIFSPFVLKHHVSFLSPFVFFYHPFCLLICCPSSFDLYVFNSTGKDQKLTTDFQKNFTFSQAWAFDLVLSLGVTTPLITPVMGISWPCILGKECFDMLKSIGFGDLVRLFSSSRRSDRVYLGWFVWDSVWRLFRMQASRRSVKAY